jgi:hypothetical protein
MEIFIAVQTSNALRTFVMGNGILAALNTIGDVHSETAMDTLKKVDFSADPREAMNRVLNSLEHTPHTRKPGNQMSHFLLITEGFILR